MILLIVPYKRNLLDVGSGYFIALNKKKTITFNFYGGLSFGKFSIDDNGLDKNLISYNRFHSSHITRWFFQPSINFMPGKYVRFSFTLKSSYVHYGKVQTSYKPEELQYFLLDKISDKTLNFIEPAWDFQFGLPHYPWVKLDMVLSSVSRPIDARWNVRQFNSSIGLTFDFSKMEKKQAK